VPVLDDAFLEVQLVDGSWLRGKYGWDGIAPLPQLVVYLAGGRCAGLEVPNDALFRWVATA
jgi:hypothetical protein